ncbi:MAG: signal transduction histidine kinase [Desulforhopalus sp.]|jgi:signal transduction histidine kinase
MTYKAGIKQKLSLIFFLFFLIFTGTVGVLLFNVQSMVQTTEYIVTNNNKIDKLADALLSSLFDMETNHKKLIILKKPRYSEYFSQAKNDFETALTNVVELAKTDGSGETWHDLEFSYYRHREGLWSTGVVPEIGKLWISDKVVSIWQNNINLAKTQNQEEIESALHELNVKSLISVRNGLYGFCLSVIVGLFGLWYLSRSIFSPLKTLTTGLRRISQNKLHKPITLRGGHEFNELATAYNEMSHQLTEEDNIRNEFIATLSHEIRTPLSSIRESVNMIVEEVFGPVNSNQSKFLKIASVEIQRINKLLNYLLNVSVLESGVRKKTASKVKPANLVHHSTEMFASFAQKKSVSLKVYTPEKSPYLYGVREELQQVFINIIGNAIKFSPEGKTVFVTWEIKTEGFILFHVTDLGPGINDQEISLVFTRYYRAKAVRGHLDGVGLGLAISKKIVTSYGGEINVKNNQTGGCTFSFTLPSCK